MGISFQHYDNLSSKGRHLELPSWPLSRNILFPHFFMDPPPSLPLADWHARRKRWFTRDGQSFLLAFLDRSPTSYKWDPVSSWKLWPLLTNAWEEELGLGMRKFSKSKYEALFRLWWMVNALNRRGRYWCWGPWFSGLAGIMENTKQISSWVQHIDKNSVPTFPLWRLSGQDNKLKTNVQISVSRTPSKRSQRGILNIPNTSLGTIILRYVSRVWLVLEIQ